MERSRRFPTVILNMAWNGRDGFCLVARNGPDPINHMFVSRFIYDPNIFSKHISFKFSAKSYKL